MKIVFVRHGESLGNTHGRFYRDDRTNFLSLRGGLQAQLASHSIMKFDQLSQGFDITISSGLTRARQTACLILQTMMDVRDDIQVDEQLNEWCWDAAPGDTWYKNEPSAEFWDRIEDSYNRYIVPIRTRPVNVLMVTHFYTMFGLFQLIRRDMGLDNLAYSELSPSEPSIIPNAVPWFYDSTVDELPAMLNM